VGELGLEKIQVGNGLCFDFLEGEYVWLVIFDELMEYGCIFWLLQGLTLFGFIFDGADTVYVEGDDAHGAFCL
jgi:hypothetical protein